MRSVAALVALALVGCHHASEERHYNSCGGVRELNGELGISVIDTPADSPAHTVTFKSMHRGLVLIDGEAKAVLREDGITTVEVPAGKHRLTLEVEGYERWERELDVKPDANVYVTVR